MKKEVRIIEGENVQGVGLDLLFSSSQGNCLSTMNVANQAHYDPVVSRMGDEHVFVVRAGLLKSTLKDNLSFEEIVAKYGDKVRIGVFIELPLEAINEGILVPLSDQSHRGCFQIVSGEEDSRDFKPNKIDIKR